MNKAAGVGGWVAAVLVLAWGGYQFRVNQDLNVQLEVQAAENVELADVIGDLSDGLDDTMTRVAELEQLASDSRMTGEFSFFRELDSLFGRTIANIGEIFLVESANQWIEGAKSLANLAGGDLSGVADMAVDFQYDAFIESLDADEARAEEIREAFRVGLQAQIDRGVEAARDGDVAGDADGVSVLREHLAEVLTDDELEELDTYRSGQLDSNVRRGVEIQLGVFASGLTRENRERVLDVLTEETLAAMNDDDTTIEDAYDRMLERVHGDLDDDQFEILEKFVDRQLSILDTSTRLFGDWLDRFNED